MTAKELYEAVRSLYVKCEKAQEWLDLSSLAGELWLKYSVSYTEHITNPERQVDFAESFISDAKRALGGYPLQYITGKTAFWNGEFLVGEGVLIPRSDTERTVELALERVKAGDIVYDLCCGSGCIGISMLKSTDKIKKCYSFDISPTALDYTAKNAVLNGVEKRLEAVMYDIMSGDFSEDIPKPDMIVSNPPYIRDDEMALLDENVRYEPEIALAGGQDGCDFYRRIISDFSKMLSPGGHILFEIAPGQQEILIPILEAEGFECSVFRDYHGKIRTICGKFEKKY